MILNYIVWNVNPDIFSISEHVPIIGGLTVRWYGLLFATGFVLGYFIMQKIFDKEGIKQKVIDDLFTYMFIFTILGARFGQVFFYEPHYYFTHPLQILMIWHGGLASHGAAVGILLGLYIFARRHKTSYIWVLDRIAIVVPLAGFFIRMGNLMNSEIFGYTTHLPWGFIFVRAMNPALRVGPHHPTQIYEGLSYLLIFFFIYRYYQKNKTHLKPGTLFGFFALLVFSARFLIEFLKEPQEVWEKHMLLDMGQLLSIPLIVGGIILLIWSAKQKPVNYVKSLADKSS